VSARREQYDPSIPRTVVVAMLRALTCAFVLAVVSGVAGHASRAGVSSAQAIGGLTDDTYSKVVDLAKPRAAAGDWHVDWRVTVRYSLVSGPVDQVNVQHFIDRNGIP